MAEKVNIDLTNLRNEIERKKQEQNNTSGRLGEPMNEKMTGSQFLAGLVRSRNTGDETLATTMIKKVHNKIAVNENEKVKLVIKEPIDSPNSVTPNNAPRNFNPNVGSSGDRDEQMFSNPNNFKKYRNDNWGNDQPVNDSNSNTGGLYDAALSLDPNYRNSQRQAQPAQQLNEVQQRSNLNEDAIRNVVNEQMVHTFSILAEEQMKNTIIELYTNEKVKSILAENHALIKQMVCDVIKELKEATVNKKK